MKKDLLLMALMTGMIALFFGCSGKNSDEACVHQATMDLDQGNYGAVLGSSCASAMQRGAAYFGRAGFDIRDVVNNFSETGETTGQAASRSDFTVYMTVLIGRVTEQSLNDMDSSKSEYNSIPAADEAYKDAQFYVSLLDAIKGLSLLKIVMDGDGNGELTTECDANGNNKPDEVDATSCAFLISASKSCAAGAGLISETTLTFSDKPGIYRGLIIRIDGSGTNTECPPSNQYQQLLFQQTSGTTTVWTPVTTMPASLCAGSDGRQWPCPFIQNGQPQDLVAVINSSLDSSVSSLSAALSGASGSDMQQSIVDLKAQACCGCDATPCASCQQACTSSSVAEYLQTYR